MWSYATISVFENQVTSVTRRHSRGLLASEPTLRGIEEGQ